MLTLYAFYPGLMSADSFDQWDQGHRWWFYDVHPPLMSALWGLLDRLVPGPALMLLFHNLLFWGGAALFWREARAGAALLSMGFAAFGFMPQVWALLGTIWKDVGLGAALLLASALVYAAARRVAGGPPRNGEEARGARGAYALLLASAPLMFYGYGVRLNAAPAVLPLALWGGFVACRALPPLRARARRLAPLTIGAAYFAALTLAVLLVTRLLVGGNTVYPSQQIFLFDLAAISKETGSPQYPEYLRRQAQFSPEEAARASSPCGVNPLIYGSSAPMRISRDAGEVAALRAEWLRAVTEHPSVYLRHRARVFACLTAFDTQDVAGAFLPATGMNNPPQFRRRPNALTRALTSYFFYFSGSPLFRGFFWLLVCAAAAYVSLRLRPRDADTEAAFVLSASGLLYGLGYFLYTPSAEFRYLWWTVLAACVAWTLLGLRAAGRRRSARAEAGAAGDDAAA